MKILYIYRNKSLGFSIANVFNSIENEMAKHVEVDSMYLPEAGANPRKLWTNIRAAIKKADSEHYDIIHITGSEHYLIPFLNRRHKVVVTVHDLGFFTNFRLSPKTLILYFGWIRSLKSAERITCISEKTQSEILKLIKLSKDRIRTIHNPVSKLFSYKKKNFNAKHPVVLHLGTKSNKNLNNTILALKDFPCELRIVGKLDKDTESLLKIYNINYVNVCNLSNEEIVKEYENCDIVNFPSLYEGFGMPIIEGQAVGRVVITSNISPMKEIADNSAVIVNPVDYHSILEGYKEAVTNNEHYVMLGMKNVQRFSLEEITDKYYNLYKELCD